MLPEPAGYPVYSVAFSPDGKTVAVGSLDADWSVWPPRNLGGTLYLWDTACAKVAAKDQYITVRDPGSKGVIQALFSPDGKLLAAQDGNDTTYLWSLAGRTPALIARFPDPEHADPAGLAFGPGNSLLTIDIDGGAYSWTIPAATGTPVTVGTPTAVFPGPPGTGLYSVAVSPDLRILALGYSNGRTYLWDLADHSRTGSLLNPNSQGVTALAFGGKDGGTLAVGDNTGQTYLWNLARDRLIGPLRSTISQHVKAVAFNPAGTILLTGDNDGYVFVWNVATRTLITKLRYAGEQSVFSVAFSPDGTTIAVGDYNRNASLWNARTLSARER